MAHCCMQDDISLRYHIGCYRAAGLELELRHVPHICLACTLYAVASRLSLDAQKLVIQLEMRRASQKICLACKDCV